MNGHPVVLFDGVCNLCNRSVQFIVDHDPDGRFHFATQQSAIGRRLLDEVGVTDVRGVGGVGGVGDTVVLVDDDGRVWRQSAAVLRILAGLRGPWRVVGVLRVVPRPVRDALYRFVAGHRYGWFGRTDECRLPRPEWRDRFLDEPVR